MLSAQTVAADSLQERLDAAAAVGFSRLGLRPDDYESAEVGDSGLLRSMEELGLSLVELSALSGWALGGEAGSRSRREEERFFRMASALGGDYLVAFGDLEGPVELAIERFGELCDRAAPFGITVALEFAPFTDVADAAVAGRIVAGAGRRNSGVLVDAWHHVRGAYDEALLLALPPDEIVAVHIDDGPEEPVGTMWDETRNARLLPGEGAFGVAAMLKALADHGVHAPVAVEVLSEQLRELPAREASALAFRTSVATVEEAGRLIADVYPSEKDEHERT